MRDKLSTSLPHTPRQARGLLTGYGEGGFKINGEFRPGGLLIYGDHALPWAVSQTSEITLASLEALLAFPGIELLLIGTGSSMTILPPEFRMVLKAKNIALDVMDTGAACRTFNVLAVEGRRIGLAAIAI